MKKYLYIINISILCLISLLSCEDHKEDNLTPSKLYIVNSGVQEVVMYNTGELAEYNLNIYKSGATVKSATARGIVLSADELQAYNEEKGTDYKMLESEYYTLAQSEVSFSGSQKDVNKAINIFFDPSKILDLSSDYVLPIKLEGSIDIESSKSICIIHPVIKEASVAFANAGLLEEEYAFGNSEDMELSIELKLNVDKNIWDVTCEAAVEESYVDEYNSDNDTNYKLLSADMYQLTTSAAIHSGTKEAAYSLTITAGELDLGLYMLPVRLKSVSKFDIDTENDLQLIVIDVYKPMFDRKKWKILEVSSEEIVGEDSPAKNSLDGDLSTYWHTKWKDGEPQPPHHIIIDMGEEKNMAGFGYAARDHYRAWPKACVLEISKDNVTWTEALSVNDLPAKAGAQVFLDFAEIKQAKYFKLTITEVYDSWATAVAEIYAY